MVLCCSNSSGLSSGAHRRVSKLLTSCNDPLLFPGIVYAGIISRENIVLFQRMFSSSASSSDNLQAVQTSEFPSLFIQVQTACEYFARICRSGHCPVVHIGGRESLFSSYALDDERMLVVIVKDKDMGGYVYSEAKRNVAVEKLLDEIRDALV